MRNKKPDEKKTEPKRSGRKHGVAGKKQEPLKIGLTGNIGSGKSTATKLFSELGVPTFDTDTVGHELLESDPQTRTRIIKAFGEKIVTDGVISRRKLAEIVFGNPEKRKTLEDILHPAIMSTVRTRLRDHGDRSYAVIEVPLLYEAQLSGEFDYIILVKAEEENAVGRASAKLGISKEEVLRRLESQIPQPEKEKLADFVIANNGTLEDLKKKVVLLHSVISSLSPDVLRNN